MNSASGEKLASFPASRALFWTFYVLGTFGPVFGTLLLTRRKSHDDSAFLFSWLLWLVGSGLLVPCVWSARKTLLGRAKVSGSVWLYRVFGWLALLESIIWAYTVVRFI